MEVTAYSQVIMFRQASWHLNVEQWKANIPGLSPVKAIRIHYENYAISSKLKETGMRYWRGVLITIQNNRKSTGKRK